MNRKIKFFRNKEESKLKHKLDHELNELKLKEKQTALKIIGVMLPNDQSFGNCIIFDDIFK